MTNSGHMDKGSSDSWGNEHTADSLGMTSWRVILEHSENSPPPSHITSPCPHLRASDGSGNSVALQFVVGGAPCSLIDGFLGQQAFVAFSRPHKDSQMGPLKMGPIVVVFLWEPYKWNLQESLGCWGRGYEEEVGGGGLQQQQGVGDGHIFEVDQSLWTVWIFLPLFLVI